MNSLLPTYSRNTNICIPINHGNKKLELPAYLQITRYEDTTNRPGLFKICNTSSSFPTYLQIPKKEMYIDKFCTHKTKDLNEVHVHYL